MCYVSGKACIISLTDIKQAQGGVVAYLRSHGYKVMSQ